MISFICCTINLTDAKNLEDNIKNTIGDIPFEFIAFDNRETHYGLCKVYNICAERAKYDYLCFLHEDLKINTLDWGQGIINKLSEEDCGVIGFAGSVLKINTSSGWHVGKRWERSNYIQHFKREKREARKFYVNPNNGDYSQVITLDGLAQFVRKDVWQEFRYDDVTFKGFHCYDLDFSIAVSQKYKNYVCNVITIEHFSEGHYSAEWVLESERLYDKWSTIYPVAYCDDSITPHIIKKLTDTTERNMLKMKVKKRVCGYNEIFNYIGKRPLSHKRWNLILKKMKYDLLKK